MHFAAGHLATITIPRGADGQSPGTDSDDVLDLVRSVGQVDVVLLLREMPGGGCKLSARSKGDFDVNRLARGFGGGGHAKASGATLAMTMEQAKAALVEAAIAQAKADGRSGWFA
ncbi:MAG: DHHA1 domain-containing protein [Planctomycetota bacterium]